MVSSRSIACGLLGVLALMTAAIADDVLTSASLSAALKDIRRTNIRLEQAATNTDKAAQLYALGREAQALAELLSREVSAHDWQQEALLNLAQRRAAGLGVNLAWSAPHRRFFYDGNAFRRYLQLQPDGIHAAASEFWLLRDEFFRSSAQDRDILLKSAARKRAFLLRFGGHSEAPRVALWLGIDYRDLWRLCVGYADPACVDEYRQLTRSQLRGVARAHEGTDIGEMAGRMLTRFESELADTDGHRTDD